MTVAGLVNKSFSDLTCAYLHIHKQQEDVNHRPKLTVTDHETTYGTRLEGKLVQGSAPWHNEEIMQLGSLGFYMKYITFIFS